MKNLEIIFIVEDEDSPVKNRSLMDFYGSIPDFPERELIGRKLKNERVS